MLRETGPSHEGVPLAALKNFCSPCCGEGRPPTHAAAPRRGHHSGDFLGPRARLSPGKRGITLARGLLRVEKVRLIRDLTLSPAKLSGLTG